MARSVMRRGARLVSQPPIAILGFSDIGVTQLGHFRSHRRTFRITIEIGDIIDVLEVWGGEQCQINCVPDATARERSPALNVMAPARNSSLILQWTTVKNVAEPADVFAVFVAEPGKLKASRNIHRVGGFVSSFFLLLVT